MSQKYRDNLTALFDWHLAHLRLFPERERSCHAAIIAKVRKRFLILRSYAIWFFLFSSVRFFLWNWVNFVNDITWSFLMKINKKICWFKETQQLKSDNIYEYHLIKIFLFSLCRQFGRFTKTFSFLQWRVWQSYDNFSREDFPQYTKKTPSFAC